MPSSDTEEIKQRLNIVDLVSQYVTLKKAGINHKGLCPFHQEKSPSFMVNGDRQIYKCFGCNLGGDCFDFVMKIEGLTFPEALQLLADRTGVLIEKRSIDKRAEGARDEKSRLYRVNQFAAKYFAQLLEKSPEAKIAREYLTKRTVTAESIKNFQIGYASAINRLAELLRAKGVTATELQRAGNPERFRSRIMFPLTDPMGNVVGFTGRTLSDDVQPKYLNTPETALFKKSRTLYGLIQAKQAIRKASHAMLVEGQMDVVLSHQAGVHEAIASSGTALTDEHLRMIRRYVPTVRFAFDTDEAGFKATERSIFTALDAGLTVEVVQLPADKKDIGEIVEADPAALSAVTATAKPVLDWLFDTLTEQSGRPTTAAAKKAFAQSALPYVARLTDPIEQDHYITELARRLKTDVAVIRTALARVHAPRLEARSWKLAGKPQPPTSNFEPLSLVEQLVTLLILAPAELKRAMSELDYTDFGSDTDRRLFKTLETGYTQLAVGPTTKSKFALEWLASHLDSATAARLTAAVLKLETTHGTDAPLEAAKEIDELIVRLQGSSHERVKRDFAERIAAAEVGHDRAAVKRLMVELQSVLAKESTTES